MPSSPTPSLDITLCMGSSCFSRGNNRNVEVLQEFLAQAAVPGTCRLVGHLCQDRCRLGPNIVINGQAFHEVDPVALLALLNHHLDRCRRADAAPDAPPPPPPPDDSQPGLP